MLGGAWARLPDNKVELFDTLPRRHLNLKPHSLAVLQKTDNHKKIVGPGVAIGS